MAGTVAVLSSCLHKLGVGRSPRLVLVAIFALQPMIVLYAGSGMSDPMLLLFLMLTASALISWMQHRQPGSLVAAGIALGLGYLARYEAGAPALAVTALVAATTAVSASGGWADRLRLALNDAALVAAPFAFAFFFWAASAKILVDQWFPTFSSRYGNSAQTSTAGIEQVTGDTLGETLAHLGRQDVGLAPVFGVLLVITAVLAIRKRNPVPLVLIAVFGSVMAFADLVLLMGLSFGWVRFQITIIPLTALLAGAVIGMLFPQTKTGSHARPMDKYAGRSWRPIMATAGVLLALAVAIPTQAVVLADPTLNLADEEAPYLSALLHPDRPGSDRWQQRFFAERAIAAWLDRRDLGEGTVLVDSAYGYAIIISSANPRQFVITSDRDFQTSVDDPRANGVKYILVQAGKPADAVQVRWPTLFADGAGIGILQRSWEGFDGEWRLYAVR
jgi:4-amino-4-deoxy-L-arabinose transferase-like glycosyltransferase